MATARCLVRPSYQVNVMVPDTPDAVPVPLWTVAVTTVVPAAARSTVVVATPFGAVLAVVGTRIPALVAVKVTCAPLTTVLLPSRTVAVRLIGVPGVPQLRD